MATFSGVGDTGSPRARRRSEADTLVISSEPDLLPEGEVDALAFKQLVLDHVFGR